MDGPQKFEVSTKNKQELLRRNRVIEGRALDVVNKIEADLLSIARLRNIGVTEIESYFNTLKSVK